MLELRLQDSKVLLFFPCIFFGAVKLTCPLRTLSFASEFLPICSVWKHQLARSKVCLPRLTIHELKYTILKASRKSAPLPLENGLRQHWCKKYCCACQNATCVPQAQPTGISRHEEQLEQYFLPALHLKFPGTIPKQSVFHYWNSINVFPSQFCSKPLPVF